MCSMIGSSGGARRTSLFVGAVFVAIAGLYLASASRFFEHVEDAVISYTYARNLAEGYGFVANLGGERVEGFSNPLWVFLLAAAHLFGASPFAASRALGITFSVGELAMAYVTYRDHLATGVRATRVVALLAPATLACMAGFQMWNHMGLENPLFGFLLSLATWLHLHELRSTRRFAWSALPLLGLLLTRPEAPLYVCILLAHKALGIVLGRRDSAPSLRVALGRAAVWVAMIVVPFAAFILWRLAYFGWPLPMPYYVKLAEKHAPTVAGLLRGDDTGVQYLSEGLRALRLLPLLALAATAPLVRRPARGACVLLAAQCAGACFFAVYSGGDWMKGWRWLHVLTVPLAPLASAGLVGVVDWVADRLRAKARVASLAAAGRVAALAGAFGVVSLWPAIAVPPKLASDLPILGDDMHERLDCWMHFASAFFVDRYSIMDGDQGALTYFAPPQVRTIDPVGLNDVEAAQHVHAIYTRPFFHEYFFEEYKPTFYGPRRSVTSVPRDYPEWAREYTMLPAHVSTRTKKGVFGGWMRKDAFRVAVLPADAGGGPVTFGCGLVLRGARVGAPVVDAGAPVRLEAYWQAPHPVKEGVDYFVDIALVDDAGRLERHIVRPLLHQAYAPSDWAPGEILRDPEELVATAPGAYAVELRLVRAPQRRNHELDTPYGPDPLPVEVPGRGAEACAPDIPGGAPGPLAIARVNVDPSEAKDIAAKLEPSLSTAPLADASAALAQLALVLGPESPRVDGARRALSARTREEELANGRRLLAEGREREAADHLLRARAQDVRDAATNDLLRGVSRHLQADALDHLQGAISRADVCAAFRELLDAVAVYPPNSHARRFAEITRPDCWSVLTRLDFGEVDTAGELAPEPTRRVFPPGHRLGLRFRWRDIPDLSPGTLPLEVRLFGPDGAVAFSKVVTLSSRHGEATVAWLLDEPGSWRYEARLEGRLETSLVVDVQPEP